MTQTCSKTEESQQVNSVCDKIEMSMQNKISGSKVGLTK